jgi:hypothetical protein
MDKRKRDPKESETGYREASCCTVVYIYIYVCVCGGGDT